MFKKKRKYQKNLKRSFVKRLFRSFVSIVILTAFVLGLSFLVKKIASLQPGEAVKLTGPILRKLGISEEKAGEVAGDFAERIFNTNIAPSKTYEDSDSKLVSSDNSPSIVEAGGSSTARTALFRVALMSDAENNTGNLEKALEVAGSVGVHAVFFLGDYTDLGELGNLQSAKRVMEAGGLLHYSLPGDRDLYDTVGPDNFVSVFGEPPVVVEVSGIKFVLVDNSANYTAIGTEKMRQYMQEIVDADFVFLSQPLYHPLASYGKPVMGLVKGETVVELKKQADELLEAIRNSSVKAIVAGDQHSYSKSEDPKKKLFSHYTLGPVTSDRADLGKASIAILSLYEDNSHTIEEVEF